MRWSNPPLGATIVLPNPSRAAAEEEENPGSGSWDGRGDAWTEATSARSHANPPRLACELAEKRRATVSKRDSVKGSWTVCSFGSN